MPQVVLTGRQRDFLASYPDEVEVSLSMGDEGVVVVEVIDAEDVLSEGEVHIVEVPREGFIDQPSVSLDDWECGLDQLYEELMVPCEEKDDDIDKVGDMR